MAMVMANEGKDECVVVIADRELSFLFFPSVIVPSFMCL